MGSELVGDSSPSRSDPKTIAPILITYTKMFYEHFPQYLAMGMTYEEYWEKDCFLVKYYRQAYEIKKRIKNEELWLQGLYIYEALCNVSPVLNAFAKSGTRPLPYSKEPYALSDEEAKERQERDYINRAKLLKEQLINKAKGR